MDQDGAPPSWHDDIITLHTHHSTQTTSQPALRRQGPKRDAYKIIPTDFLGHCASSSLYRRSLAQNQPGEPLTPRFQEYQSQL